MRRAAAPRAITTDRMWGGVPGDRRNSLGLDQGFYRLRGIRTLRGRRGVPTQVGDGNGR